MMINIKDSNKGFSLVELLMVVVLIAILASIAFPTLLTQIGHIRLTRATRDVAVALQAARLKAITMNRKHKVYFTPGVADSYVLMACSAGGACPNPTLGAGDGWAADTTTEYGTTKTMATTLNVAPPAAAYQVIFYPAGTATNQDNTQADQTICISNTNSATDAMKIVVKGASGRLTVDTGCV